jgi:diguanylate cyclase (GGDEF)-like protein
MKRAIASLRSAAAIRPEERALAGQAGGAVWVIASLSVIAMALVLPATEVHRGLLAEMGIAGCVWGAFSGLLLDYRRLPVWLIHASTAAGVVSIAVAIALSGDARSPAWPCLFYVVVFAAYFLKPLAAAGYFLACVAVECVVLFTSSGPGQGEQLARLVVEAIAFLVLGSAIVAGKGYMWRLRRQAERLAAEQGALRRVATAVVSGEPAERFYEIVAVEAGQLLAAGAAGILRLEGPGEAEILGVWAGPSDHTYKVGDRVPISSDSALAHGLAEVRPVRASRYAPESSLGRLGYGSSIVSPITVAGRTWGFLAVASPGSGSLTGEHERRLNEFGDLISTAITSIEDRATLAAQAATDALTGVANHRTFHERLTADLARARRYGTPVSVAMIDVDHFKLINDAGGHKAGDEVLVRVARCLTDATRAEDTLARVGGDEFAWILPETTAKEARAAVDRAREAITGGGEGAPPVTISAGICDSRWTSDPSELMRLADRALYSSKEHGRDQIRVYSPSGVDELADPLSLAQPQPQPQP